MAQLNVSDLDFATIKANLKTFLSSQAEFQDYNFDGAGMSVLMDLLAYNTHYNATLAHLAANEMFIDTAVKRSSVVSIAKTMGYFPRTISSARAVVNIRVTPDPSYTSQTLILPETIPFKAVVDGEVLTFYPAESVQGTYVDGVFQFQDVELVEGTRITNSFAVDLNTVSGPFTLPNANIDKSTIRVRVQTSASTQVITTFNFSDTVLDVGRDSNVFYVEENGYGLLEVRFGDGVISKKLNVGNIVYVDYIVSKGKQGNGVGAFTIGGTLTGSRETKGVSNTVLVASGGNDAETIEEIRLNAPLFNATKNRAVTATDYATLIKSRFSNVDSVVVWGGEENDPPIYGKVFLSINPVDNSVITEENKSDILNNIVLPRSVVSIKPEFIDPVYHYVSSNTTIKYDNTITSLSPGDIQREAYIRIENYFKSSLSSFEKNFYYSDFVRMLQEITSSIYAVDSQILVHRRFDVYNGFENRFELTFNAAVVSGSIRSTNFTTQIGGISSEVFLSDDTTGDTLSESGDIVMKKLNGDILVHKVGRIDYATGKVSIPSLFISSLSGNLNQLRLYFTPFGQSPNILTSSLFNETEWGEGASFPVASRNIVLKLDDSQIDTYANVSRGTTVNAIPTNGKR